MTSTISMYVPSRQYPINGGRAQFRRQMVPSRLRCASIGEKSWEWPAVTSVSPTLTSPMRKKLSLKADVEAGTRQNLRTKISRKVLAMILMVSVQNLEEALQALKGGADIIDVKNLQEALVGSAHPHIVRDVRNAIPMERHASVTLGVVPHQVGTVAMAVYAAGVINATSVKVGFMDHEYELALETLHACKRGARRVRNQAYRLALC